MSPRASGSSRGERVPIDPDDHIHVIGRTFAKHERLPLLAIGNHHWNRWSLGRLGCPHPVAAATLNRVIQQLKITTLAELAERAQEIGTYKGCGETAYWTVLSILHDAGYNVDEVHGEKVTYHTVKARARRDERRDTPRKRAHKGKKG